MYKQKKTITIEGTAERFFAGLIENDVLTEYHRFSLTDPVVLGCIVKGQVQKESGTLHSYYVNLQMDHPGFWNAGHPVKGGTQPIVQIIQEPRGKKGYRVTEHYTIPGHYLVLTPFDTRIHVSLRIEDQAEQQRLREMAHALPGDGRVGWILRTEALHADSESIFTEGAYLYDLYSKIENRGITAPVGAILYEPVHPLISFLSSTGLSQEDEIVCEAKELLRKLQMMKDLPAQLKSLFKLFDQGRWSLSEFYKIRSALDAASRREVPLPGGGSIVIDETEALIVIDVNSGGSAARGSSREDSIFNVNAKACPVITEQIRLRNLSGIIIIDFIDMKRDSDREKLLELMKRNAKKDRQRVTIHGYTHLGLMELSRKRESVPLAAMLADPH